MSTPTPKSVKSARWSHLNGFVDITLRDLTPAEVRVWLILFRDTKKNGLARTGQASIAERSGLSVRMVKKAVKMLVAKDIVKVRVRGQLNIGPSVYKVRGVNTS